MSLGVPKAEEKRAGGAKQKAPRPWPSVGRTKEAKKTGTEARPVATPLKVKLPELPGGLDWALPAKKCLPHFPEVSADLMILAQEAQRLDPRLPAKKQLNEFLLKPTRFVSRSRLATGRPVEALKAAKLAAATFQELGDVASAAGAQGAAALAHLELGQLPEAVSLASKAPQDLAERGLRRACAEALRVASRVYLDACELERAMQVGLEAGDRRSQTSSFWAVWT
eukprot:g11187.t1